MLDSCLKLSKIYEKIALPNDLVTIDTRLRDGDVVVNEVSRNRTVLLCDCKDRQTSLCIASISLIEQLVAGSTVPPLTDKRRKPQLWRCSFCTLLRHHRASSHAFSPATSRPPQRLSSHGITFDTTPPPLRTRHLHPRPPPPRTSHTHPPPNPP